VDAAIAAGGVNPDPAAPDAGALPLVLAGPLLRRMQARRVAWWLACTQACELRLTLRPADGPEQIHAPQVQTLRAGERLFFLLVELTLDQDLPTNTWTGYRF